MFRWYARAVKCYAYLEDVDVKSLDPATFATKFRQSHWLSRGWTLQELIAPEVVEFYDRNWYAINAKTDMISVLEYVTRIPEAVLRNRHALTRCSIAQRMSWAAMRQTTRIEDEAYCLLGIFDINLPLLYGEGRKAYQRLQEEIIRASATVDHSILAWKIPDAWSIWSFDHFDENSPVEASTLLAPSPWCFRDAQDIISWANPQAETFEITKTGLRITASMVDGLLDPVERKTPEKSDIEAVDGHWKNRNIEVGGHWIALNCRYLDKPDTMIAIGLLHRLPVKDFGVIRYRDTSQTITTESEMVYERYWQEAPSDALRVHSVDRKSFSRQGAKAWEKKTLTMARQRFRYPWHGERVSVVLRDGCHNSSNSPIHRYQRWLLLTHLKDEHVLEGRLDIEVPGGQFKKDATITIVVCIQQDGFFDRWSTDLLEDSPRLFVYSSSTVPLYYQYLKSGKWHELPTGKTKHPLYVLAQYVHLAEEYLWTIKITTLSPETDRRRA